MRPLTFHSELANGGVELSEHSELAEHSEHSE